MTPPFNSSAPIPEYVRHAGTLRPAMDGTTTVRFDRLIEAPIECVWEHFERPELFSLWLPRSSLDAHWGGEVDFDIMDDARASGRVAVVVSPEEGAAQLRHTWENEAQPVSYVLWTFSREGKATRIVLTHRDTFTEDVVNVATAWHFALDSLVSVLRDSTLPNEWDPDGEIAEMYAAHASNLVFGL